MASPGTKNAQGAQIDLLIDRDDRVINICEMKYSASKFEVTKAYARDLRRKLEVIERRFGAGKELHLTLVTTHGLKPTRWSDELVDSVVTAEDLFKQ